MGEVVAAIRCVKGRPTIEDWIWHEKLASTTMVASRFCLRTSDALAALKKLERAGKVQRVKHECGYRQDVAWWTAEISAIQES